MNDVNPYATPKAPVADIHPSEEAEHRPTTVTAAITLLWTKLGLGVLVTLITIAAGNLPTVPWRPTLLASAVALVLCFAWLNWKVGARRNWARVVCIVLSLIGFVAPYILPDEHTAPAHGVWKYLNHVQDFMELAVFILLLTPSAALWFKRAKAQASTPVVPQV
jgi:hypothetical protein